VREPVAVSGVKVGRVAEIELNPKTYRAEVILQINSGFKDLPVDTSASILTQGILGSNYVSLSPGYEQQLLQPGGRIETTHSALILENLIGQLMFNLSNNKDKNASAASKKT
jgi:phospholipid/cholesterol/gamma-HCH transport system substrate-binding protein